MALYRKIAPPIWNDAKFRELSLYGKLIFFNLITHPNQTSLGAMRATIPGLACELGMDLEAYRVAFEVALKLGLIEYDEKATCVYIPNFVRYQSAESPNTIKAWAKQVEWIPECHLKTRAIAGLEAYAQGLTEAFQVAFRVAFGDAWRAGYPESVNSEQGVLKPPPTEGAAAPAAVDPIFGHGLSLLKAKGCTEKSARSFLGLMRKNHGDALVVEAIGKAELEDISDLIPWLRKYMESKPKISAPRRPAHEDFSAREYGQGGKL
ncbi:MAG: hypothetical protein NT159_05800 [Proteobacteria bacterium]|nr:hypothetical protein [Pseudomonadota bacterium]